LQDSSHIRSALIDRHDLGFAILVD
jgi:hypothetical protein